MSSVYKRLNWADRELITTDKLNDMVGNADYLYENMVTGYYDANGIIRDTGLSMRVGYAKVANTDDSYWISATYYSRPFITGARPVIVDGWACDGNFGEYRAIRGLDGSALPDNKGFYCLAYQGERAINASSPTNFAGSQYFGWIALAPNG